MVLDYISILILIAVVVNSFLTLLIHVRSERNHANTIFKFTALAITGWCLSMFLYRSSSSPADIFWARMLYFFPSFIPAGFLLFAIHFPNEKIKIKPTLIILGFSVIVASLTLQDGAVIENVLRLPNEEKFLVFGWAYYVFFIVHISALFLFSYYVLYKKYLNNKGLIKKQILVMFLTLLFSSSVATFSNLILPSISIFSLNWLGQVFTFFWIGGVAYAIVKHQLLDVRSVVARAVTYMVILVIFGFVYAGGIIFLGSILTGYVSESTELIFRVILALVVAFTFVPFKKVVEKITRKSFFQGMPDFDLFLKEIGEIASNNLNIKLLTKNTLKKILTDFQIEKGFFSPISEENNFDIKTSSSENLEGDLDLKMIRKWVLKNKKDIILVKNIRDKEVREYLRLRYYYLILRFTNKDKLVGFLMLGEKKSGGGYYGEEIRLFELIIPNVSVALNNTLQYQKIEKFAETLKQKVKEATEKVNLTNKKLKELDKKKDEFISVAAHELRAPLTAVKGYLSMIMEGDAGKIPEEAKEFIEGAVIGAEREIRLVNDMLNVSRIEENRLVYQMGEVRLLKVVKEVFGEFKLDAETEGLKFSLEIAKDIKDIVHVDIDRIHEVVANYISNAIKYTDKGSVEVKLTNPDKNNIRFEVIDTGYGMSEEEQKKLFSKFYRAASSSGKVLGTGLGLYIVKLLVEKFGGKVGLESKLEKGSNFWLELPLK